MWYILDTDHLTILHAKSQPACDRLAGRLAQCDAEEIATTIISFQEQMRGWLGMLNRPDSAERSVYLYSQLQAVQQSFCRIRMLPFDAAADQRYIELRKQLRRHGTMDLRIAAIALTRNATLLSRNLRDFQQVPNLTAEDWTLQ